MFAEVIMDEKKLVLQAKKDIQAFEALYQRYFPDIFRFVMYRVGNRSYAEEIVSNTFFKAMDKLHLFKWRSIPFSAWLFRIAVSEISNYFRADKRHKKIENMYVDKAVLDEKTERFSYDFIHQYIKQLPEKDQNIIILRFFEKKSFSEISEMLGKKESTLRVNLHRSLKKLEKLIPAEVLEDVYQKVS